LASPVSLPDPGKNLSAASHLDGSGFGPFGTIFRQRTGYGTTSPSFRELRVKPRRIRLLGFPNSTSQLLPFCAHGPRLKSPVFFRRRLAFAMCSTNGADPMMKRSTTVERFIETGETFP
jgi:hypothetical protein